MKFLTYIYDKEEKVGVISQDGRSVLDVGIILEWNRNFTMVDLIKNFSEIQEEKIRKAMKENNGIEMSKIKLEAPIPEPARGVICLGKNYKDHVKEVPSAMDLKGGIPENPIYFYKLVDRAIAHEENIPCHEQITKELDYEVELAVVIGKEGKNIPLEQAEEYIFGYTILNDISARDLQTKHIQWFRGKSLDGTCPMGPYLVYKSEIKSPVELEIQCYVNGELRQNSNTREMIFNIPYIISDLSRETTLKPGDIISTGTPAGVGMGFTPRKLLKSKDEIVCKIEKIGELRNVVL